MPSEVAAQEVGINLREPRAFLAEMQENGPPNTPPLTSKKVKAALTHLKSGVSQAEIRVDPRNKEAVLSIASLLIVKVTLYEDVQRAITGMPNGDEAQGPLDSLVEFGKKFATEVSHDAEEVIKLGFNEDDTAKALSRLKPDQITEIFSDSIFKRKGKFVLADARIVLRASDAQGLFDRIKEHRKKSSLKKLSVRQIGLLVRTPEKTNERLSAAVEKLEQGYSTKVAVEYAYLSTDNRAWFDRLIEERPEFKCDCSPLIEIADKSDREDRMAEVERVHALGAPYYECFKLVSRRDYKEKLDIFEQVMLLEKPLCGAAAYLFAHSKEGVENTDASLAIVSRLKDLPLDWSDDFIVRVVANLDARQSNAKRRKRGSAQLAKLSPREQVKAALKALAKQMTFKKRDLVHTFGLKLIAGFDRDQIHELFSIFLEPDEFRGLDTLLETAAEADQEDYRAYVALKTHELKEDIPPSDVQVTLSQYLLSTNQGVRQEVISRFHAILMRFTRTNAYSRRFIEIEPNVVEKMIESAINNYDPSNHGWKRDRPGIEENFPAYYRRFYIGLVRYRLKDQPLAKRAIRLFSELQAKLRKQEESDVDQKAWEMLSETRPDLRDHIPEAKRVYQDVCELKKRNASDSVSVA